MELSNIDAVQVLELYAERVIRRAQNIGFCFHILLFIEFREQDPLTSGWQSWSMQLFHYAHYRLLLEPNLTLQRNNVEWNMWWLLTYQRKKMVLVCRWCNWNFSVSVLVYTDKLSLPGTNSQNFLNTSQVPHVSNMIYNWNPITRKCQSAYVTFLSQGDVFSKEWQVAHL